MRRREDEKNSKFASHVKISLSHSYADEVSLVKGEMPLWIRV